MRIELIQYHKQSPCRMVIGALRDGKSHSVDPVGCILVENVDLLPPPVWVQINGTFSESIEFPVLDSHQIINRVGDDVFDGAIS